MAATDRQHRRITAARICTPPKCDGAKIGERLRGTASTGQVPPARRIRYNETIHAELITEDEHAAAVGERDLAGCQVCVVGAAVPDMQAPVARA
jgi:hypothetical protein